MVKSLSCLLKTTFLGDSTSRLSRLESPSSGQNPGIILNSDERRISRN